MFPLFTFEWVASEIGKWLGFSLTERAIKRLASSLKSAPKTADEVFEFDRNIRYEAVGEINLSERNVLLTMNLATCLNEGAIFNSLGITRSKLGRLSVSIESSKDLLVEKKSSAKGLMHLDFILLTSCFVVNERTRDLLDKLHENKRDEATALMEKINEHIRKLDSLIHVRSVALSNPDPQFVRILEADHNDIYEALRSLAVLAYSAEEKKGFLRRGEYYGKLCGRSLYAAKVLEDKHGPEIDFKIFFSEFKKMNPDLEVPPKDLEKTLETLVNDEWIFGIEQSEEGPKKVWTKLDCQKVLNLAREENIRKSGLTIEELINRTGWSAAYASCVLSSLEDRGVARKAVDPDGTVKWFFPGLNETSKQKELA